MVTSPFTRSRDAVSFSSNSSTVSSDEACCWGIIRAAMCKGGSESKCSTLQANIPIVLRPRATWSREIFSKTLATSLCISMVVSASNGIRAVVTSRVLETGGDACSEKFSFADGALLRWAKGNLSEISSTTGAFCSTFTGGAAALPPRKLRPWTLHRLIQEPDCIKDDRGFDLGKSRNFSFLRGTPMPSISEPWSEIGLSPCVLSRSVFNLSRFEVRPPTASANFDWATDRLRSSLPENFKDAASAREFFPPTER
mmetsp:Transcript_15799/g.31744  ORF Transcript_15799/g.31744 Transcript_15799/m.31744 type:complete len:255 (-) Transcript_15799:971-1735(-)